MRRRTPKYSPNVARVAFFPRDMFRGSREETPYSPEERDALLDYLLEDASPASIRNYALLSGRTPKAVTRQFETYLYGDKDTKIGRYVPTDGRRSRKGKRLTGTEKILIKAHQSTLDANGNPRPPIPVELTAVILMRDVAEIEQWIKENL